MPRSEFEEFRNPRVGDPPNLRWMSPERQERALYEQAMIAKLKARLDPPATPPRQR